MSNAATEQRPRLRSFNKRRNRHNYVQVTDFLLGGNIQDPLNLASIDPNEQNQKTPVCSPIPTPQYNKEIDILIPTDLSDPLKLNNCEIKESSELCHSLDLLISPNKTSNKRQNLNKRKRTESDSIVSDLKEDLINKRMKLDLKTIKSNLKDKLVPIHKIVSPVVPQKCNQLNSDRFHHHNHFVNSSNSKQRTNVNNSSFHLNDNQINKQQSTKLKSQIKLQNSKQLSINCKSKDAKKPFIFESNQNQFYYARGRKFNLKDQKFQYGNYSRYYGYRLINQNNQNQDLRLVHFKKEWFENKIVLDVGCNVGYITYLIARDFKPTKIVGLDIDAELIKTAKSNIKNYLENQNEKDKTTNSSNEFPVSLSICHGPLSEIKKEINKEDLNKNLNQNSIKNLTNDDEKDIEKKNEDNEKDHLLVPNNDLNEQSTKNQFPNNVQFIAANYVLPNDELLSMQKPEYDCILCLSVTKWIHLNFGDDGIYRLFKRVYLQLKPNGVFILEPQPIFSYKRKKALTETTLKNYNSIKFKPDQFKDYLLSKEIGFNSCEIIEPPNNNSKDRKCFKHSASLAGLNQDLFKPKKIVSLLQ